MLNFDIVQYVTCYFRCCDYLQIDEKLCKSGPRNRDAILYALSKLESDGHVVAVGIEGEHSRWRLTAQGQASVTICVDANLKAATRLAAVRADVELKSMDLCELIEKLVDDDWVHEVRPPTSTAHVSAGLPLFYKLGEGKRWFTVVGKLTVGRFYLICLHLAEKIGKDLRVYFYI